MTPGLWRYLKAAFSYRPLGMFVPPNWIGLAAFAVLGFLSWGFLAIGAGVELAYLLLLVQSARFRRLVDGEAARGELEAERGRADEVLERLDRDGRARYEELRARCRRVLDEHAGDRAGRAVHEDALQRLLWLQVKLLRARQTLAALLREARERGEDQANLDRRARDLERKLAGADGDLRRSLDNQLEILRQRAARQREAQAKVDGIDAELERIEQQVELVREDLVLEADTRSVSLRIDAVSSSLTETMQWVRAQDDLAGSVDDLDEEAPPLLADAPQRRAAR
ncbi:MAG: hypothetical protein IT372_01575 [Polyangiaceae bacterium]|nr:hypothetical protein [Polyangiaceae bacterium]